MRILLTAAAVVVASLASVNAQRALLVLLVNIAEYFDDVYVADRAETAENLGLAVTLPRAAIPSLSRNPFWVVPAVITSRSSGR